MADTSCDTEEDEVDESVDSSIDCSILSKVGETSVNLDAEFTFCGEHPHAVGRCFLEVLTLSLILSSDIIFPFAIAPGHGVFRLVSL